MEPRTQACHARLGGMLWVPLRHQDLTLFPIFSSHGPQPAVHLWWSSGGLHGGLCYCGLCGRPPSVSVWALSSLLTSSVQ